MARNLNKRLTKLTKKFPELEQFRISILNHFWYSCQSCGGNAEVLIERFHSCLLHTCNIHAWNEDPFNDLKEERAKKRKTKKKKGNCSTKTYPHFSVVRKCAHSRTIKSRRLKGMQWLSIGSEVLKALFNVLTDTQYSNNLTKM